MDFIICCLVLIKVLTMVWSIPEEMGSLPSKDLKKPERLKFRKQLIPMILVLLSASEPFSLLYYSIIDMECNYSIFSRGIMVQVFKQGIKNNFFVGNSGYCPKVISEFFISGYFPEYLIQNLSAL